MKRILLATDGQPASARAEAYAIHLAAESGAPLTAMYVVESDLLHYGMVDQLATEGDKAAFIEHVRREGERECVERLSEFDARARARGVAPERVVRWGAPLKEIVSTASDVAADVLVVGGASWGVRWTSPSVSSSLERKSPCSVRILS